MTYLQKFAPQDNERAMELLNRISEIYKENADYSRKRVRHAYRVPREIQFKIIDLSVNEPNLLEEKLADEPSIHELIEWVRQID